MFVVKSKCEKVLILYGEHFEKLSKNTLICLSKVESTERNKRQVKRLKTQCANIDKMCQENGHCLLGGDINLDKNLSNDPLKRPELRALCPIWDTCMIDNGLLQLNFKPTWHMPGKNASLIDLYYSNKPEKVDGVNDVSNLLSKFAHK